MPLRYGILEMITEIADTRNLINETTGRKPSISQNKLRLLESLDSHLSTLSNTMKIYEVSKKYLQKYTSCHPSPFNITCCCSKCVLGALRCLDAPKLRDLESHRWKRSKSNTRPGKVLCS